MLYPAEPPSHSTPRQAALEGLDLGEETAGFASAKGWLQPECPIACVLNCTMGPGLGPGHIGHKPHRCAVVGSPEGERSPRSGHDRRAVCDLSRIAIRIRLQQLERLT